MSKWTRGKESRLFKRLSEGVGFQSQDPIWRWARSYGNNDIQVDSEAWKHWNIWEWLQSFDFSITIALEAIIWRKYHRTRKPSSVEQQIAVRILGEGKMDGDGGVRVSMTMMWRLRLSSLGSWREPKRNAKWRAWWRGKELKGFAQVSHCA